MSDNNEIDDIIKEIRNKNEELDTEKKAPEFEETPVETAPEPQSEEFTVNTDEYSPEFDEADYEAHKKVENNKKKIAIIAVAAIAIVAIIVTVVVFAVKNKSKDEETTTQKPSTTVSTTAAPVVITNPLTGEKGYNKSAVDVRPVACVVENSYYARPQWGIDSKSNSPDIILEGEVEGGESRMLWFYADYTSLPDQIGPMRSARPPFIKFSEMFDAIFIHWGQSASKGNYVGAKTVFKQDNVDHINEMTTPGVGYLYGRDSSRNAYGVEHTGILHGDKVAQAIKDCGFRTEVDSSAYTKFAFNDKEKAVGKTACNTLGLTFSSRTQSRDWTYNSDDKMYHTEDFSNSNIGFSDVKRKNLLVLFDNTAYIVKNNYKNSGSSETYCDYKLSGGNGKLASLGTVIDITWSVENGKLSVKDSAGKEVKLNVGTTWIGWGSSNNGGSVAIG
ncbi:MAG: DUF3048 domain-containing protein [Eubacterium sp.]|nr:DUF3048 domain-containing protein [Eubacterium sp.]